MNKQKFITSYHRNIRTDAQPEQSIPLKISRKSLQCFLSLQLLGSLSLLISPSNSLLLSTLLRRPLSMHLNSDMVPNLHLTTITKGIPSTVTRLLLLIPVAKVNKVIYYR